ncbi:MAG: transcription elongation factor GreA [Arenicellales bacterium]|nr:transcription elongation factor GreA [Acidiferrobacteraceae bacterium]MDP6435104.1 transcription elongation factor GreA [Arenicellales bacterium]MDP6672153.1 transcription elongation factor GreA [Arenicellales bacterium]MDP6724502.1 transcription elongation factor GreA [Arenicellales bacterium]MDP7155879.1 transcription elongation factor GreA [Arenicellales bacterium]|tara:strand:+ start:1682 stop:2158 length:477 start_codon:yes stop_codon:yes gene_type:complete
MTRVLLTSAGAEMLRDELQRLKTNDRPNVIKAIAEARAHGDLSENAEYHAAREQQGFIEGRIKELESKLSRAEVIDPATLNPGRRIVFGATVTLLDIENNDEVTYQIVGDLEADLDRGQVSLGTPIARGLIGKEEGDEVEVKTPKGAKLYEVLSVRYQ